MDKPPFPPHVTRIDGLVLEPADGLLLGNGDLSVSIYQAADEIRWRFGKNDVWDRRMEQQFDPKPAHIQEIAHGITVEGWTCPPYGEQKVVGRRRDRRPEAPPTRGGGVTSYEFTATGDQTVGVPSYTGLEDVDREPLANPRRAEEICQGAPPSHTWFPYPCPKPVGELALRLPADHPQPVIEQELFIEEARVAIHCRWASGLRIDLDCFVPPKPNLLVIRWRVSGWNQATAAGGTHEHIGPAVPLWFGLYRWPDPTVQEFGAAYFGRHRNEGFRRARADLCTPLPPPTTRRVGDHWAIEQKFPADPVFPEGFRCLMAGALSELIFAPVETSTLGAPPGEPTTAALIEPVDMGLIRETGPRPVCPQHRGWRSRVDTNRPQAAQLHLVPPTGAVAGVIRVGVTTSSDGGTPETALAGALAAAADRESLAATNAAAAREFWSRSGVSLGETLLENLWYEALHVSRCVHRHDTPPPGIYLPSTIPDYTHWHGDYHTNYNYQSNFLGQWAANQIANGDAYFRGMDFFLPIGRKIARDYYGCRGVFIQLSGFATHPVDDPIGCAPMGRMAYMTGWVLSAYWWRYRFTMDRAWLQTVGYPVLREMALFYTDFVQLGPDGLYHAFPSNEGEDGFNGDPTCCTDRPQVIRYIRYGLHCALAAAAELGTDAGLQAQWREILDRLAPEGGDPARTAALYQSARDEWLGPEFFAFDGAMPGETIAADGRPKFLNPGHAQFRWYGGKVPMEWMGHVRRGTFQPGRDWAALVSLLNKWRRPNGQLLGLAIGSYGRGGALTESLGILGPIQEMLLQSWDGVVRVFPAWPQERDAAFHRLRAHGAFLVSAVCGNGRVESITIESLCGGTCTLANPWPGIPQVSVPAGQSPDGPRDSTLVLVRETGDQLRFATQAGRSYVLRG